MYPSSVVLVIREKTGIELIGLEGTILIYPDWRLRMVIARRNRRRRSIKGHGLEDIFNRRFHIIPSMFLFPNVRRK